jgi:AraC-like DNA-binding protein
MASLEPLDFDSDDVGLIEATVSKLYSKLKIDAVGDDTRTRIARRVMAPGIGFDDLDYSFDIGYAGEAQRNLIICDVVSSTIHRVGEGHDETFGPGDPFLISRPDLPYAGTAHSAKLRFAVLDPAIIDRMVAAEGGGADPVGILDHRPVSAAAARRLQRSIAYVRSTVLAADAAASPLVVSTAAQFLAAGVLQAFPNSATVDPPVESRHDSNEGTLGRAVAFIEANPDADIALSDIAAAAHVTPRALQLAFRRHLDTTPMAYLRRVRLEQAHEDLLAGSPGTDTVAAIAARWGFAHPGRFSGQHRVAFGEQPSATLRR